MTDPQPDERLPATFGRHVARWAHEQGAAPAACRLAQCAAALVSQAIADGHSCVGLSELADLAAPANPVNLAALVDVANPAAMGMAGERRTPFDVAACRTALLESRVVGTPEAPGGLPLILDGERLYLHRYFDYECRLADSLTARAASRSNPIALDALTPNIVALLDRLFSADPPQRGVSPPAPAVPPSAHGVLAPRPAVVPPDAPDWQKIAAITALLGNLTIISGGPGTGKTTAVVNLLACLLAANPDCRVVLAAPTGKAAARMTEVILQRAGHLPDALRAKLPAESFTIHRLLGGTPDGRFRYHAGNELPIDVLVVDEASMLDLALAVHLLEAVPAGARIILLGDKDQLAAVESGAVFSELSAQPAFSPERIQTLSRLGGVPAQALQAPLQPTQAPPVEPSVPSQPQSCLVDSVVWLRRNYRFAAGSSIGLLAADINDGNAARALARLQDPSDRSLLWINDGGSVPSRHSMQSIQDGYAPYREAVRAHVNDPGATTAAFAQCRVLCALRDGPWGVDVLNREIASRHRRALQHPLDSDFRADWYPGRPVMVLRNDPVLKLFNGDIGIVLPDTRGVLQVWFPDETGSFRSIAPVRLPDHETAFAMTVHKSQGSEFGEVLLVLPAENNRVLNRELFYTAVTRARARLTIVASARVVASTIGTATERLSGLSARLRASRSRDQDLKIM